MKSDKLMPHLRVLIIGVILFMCSLSLAACNSVEQVTLTSAVTQSVTITETATNTPAATPTSTQISNAIPSPTNTPPIQPELAGLLYRYDGMLWITNVAGSPERYSNRLTGNFSPDGTQEIYSFEGDLWLVDVVTNERRNLTDTPNVQETGPKWSNDGLRIIYRGNYSGTYRANVWFMDISSTESWQLENVPYSSLKEYFWWPEYPDEIIVTSLGVDPENPFNEKTIIIAVNIRTREQTVIDDNAYWLGSLAIPSDAGFLAFDHGKLYYWNSGLEYLNPLDFGLDDYESNQFVSPTFSPDGEKLLWYLNEQDSREISIVIIDIETQIAKIIHRFDPGIIDVANWPGPPSWSPDGNWIFSWGLREDFDGSDGSIGFADSTWVISIDGQKTAEFLNGRNIIWSPDSTQFILEYSIYEEGGYRDSLSLVEVGTWQEREDFLPPGSRVVDWILLE
ncbi:MAG: hypothetical protein FVQ83_05540 [Chloroflexi bacterium]|nr:hypothetical protein [Chloroflexota bacterium]